MYKLEQMNIKTLFKHTKYEYPMDLISEYDY